jgi:lipopolysaccharide transport system permease protein
VNTADTLTLSPARPELVRIRPPRRFPHFAFGSVWRARDLLLIFAHRDIKLRYRQTILGGLWVVIGPTLSAGIFSIVFSGIAHLPSSGVPYFLLALSGMVGWTAFSNAMLRGSVSLANNAQLIAKMNFERLALPAGILLASLADLLVTLAVFAIGMAVAGIAPGLTVLTLPIWLLLLLGAGGGVGLLAATVMVRYRDMGPIVNLSLSLLLYICPVAYSTVAIPRHLRVFYDINPLVPMLNGVRWSLLNTPRPSAGSILYAVVFTIAIVVVSLVVFRTKERRFADVI